MPEKKPTRREKQLALNRNIHDPEMQEALTQAGATPVVRDADITAMGLELRLYPLPPSVAKQVLDLLSRFHYQAVDAAENG